MWHIDDPFYSGNVFRIHLKCLMLVFFIFLHHAGYDKRKPVYENATFPWKDFVFENYKTCGQSDGLVHTEVTKI